MRVPKWLPWILGTSLPVVLLALAVKWSRPGVPALTPPSPVTTSAPGPAPENPRVRTEVFGSKDKDLRKVIYRLSEGGNPLTCDVFDESGSRLAKCRFGYDVKPGPTRGKLVEVQIFDARAAAKVSGRNEKPLRRIIRSEAGGKAPVIQTVDNGRPGEVDAILGSALAGFDPMTEWISASEPATAR